MRSLQLNKKSQINNSSLGPQTLDNFFHGTQRERKALEEDTQLPQISLLMDIFQGSEYMRPDNKERKCRTIMEEVLTETATKLKPTLQGVETKSHYMVMQFQKRKS